jgi:hypothetical protein
MRKALLSSIVVLASFSASAQCTPNQLYADSVYGVWPDTTENFMSGMANVFYSDTLNILVPTDAGLIDPGFAGFTIDSVAFDSVSNLPPGLSVVCNSQTAAPCTYLSNQVGCGLIEGIPTTTGTYDMVLNVTAYTTLGFFVLPVPQQFSGYSITINANNVGVAEMGLEALSNVRTVPNPATSSLRVEFTLGRSTNGRVVLFNLVGEEVANQRFTGRQGLNAVPMNVEQLENGIYLYKVQAGGKTFTGRVVVDH